MKTEIDERSDFGNSFPICFVSIIKGASKSWMTDYYIFYTPTIREPKITHTVAASSAFNSVLYIQQSSLLFFSRVASFKTCLRQCIGVEWLEVEIVSFVLFINLFLKKLKKNTFDQFHQKSGVIVQKLNWFLSTVCTFLTSPLFWDISSGNFDLQSKFSVH